MQLCALSNFLDQWKSITFNRFVVNMIKGHLHHLKCHPLLFQKLKWFNFRVLLVHYAVILEEVDLLAKDSIKPSMRVAGFYCNVYFVVQFNCYVHILTFKMPVMRQV